MKTIKPYILSAVAVLLFIQCETPGDPNFTLSHQMDTPLIAESRFQFLGDKNALIDTTSEDFSDLFTVDGDHLITLTKQDLFEFEDLNDAIPVIDATTAQFETQVGEISISDFSSQDENGNLGEAGFENLTGQTVTPQEGDFIPGAQSPFPVNIDLDTDFFESATIKQGSIEIVLRNELGIDLDLLTLELFSDDNSVGSVTFSNFSHGTTESDKITIVENPDVDPEVLLTNLNVDVEIEWSGQTLQTDPGSLIVNGVQGQDLVASQVVAQIPSQDFFFSGSADFDNSEFNFTSADHYVELQSGTLSIENILNSIDLEIPSLQISFPDIRTAPWTEADSLVISFEGANAIPANNSQPISQSVDLTNTRIYAQNNEIKYNTSAITEDTQDDSGNSLSTINESDAVSADVNLDNLTISEAFGVPSTQQALLNNDDPSNGTVIDLLNDSEAEIIEIDGIRDLSQKVDGIEFSNASLDFNYSFNSDLPVRVIGAFLGRDSNGNQFFLQALPGTNRTVTDATDAERLRFDGNTIPANDLIQFEIDHPGDPEITEQIIFDRTNTTINEFFSRLPDEIRFVGIALVNEEETSGTIRNPIQFNPEYSVNIPLSLRAENATFVDTTSQDLGNLPGPDDDSMIEEGSLEIQYGNRIPLGFTLRLDFLDENNRVLTTAPVSNDDPLRFDAAPVDGNGISTAASNGNTTLSLSRSQLDLLNQTRNIRLSAGVQTSDGDEVSIRDTDDVTIRISGRFKILNQVN
ncbi:hypothetical protein [Rhodohalobacter barkolensis]|uniref:Uncharacterized protein n=1 Tax=Rhodohalobacter barkolensis TaxID=2053187 RepID=A0A2N0VKA4_9BACT|nr:hypothetical protein [Rhodohalobacter barkolensis]PKD44622.1 hypothetical protein CWD77_03940 [Rhodohalobacter barkolensis]